MKAFVRSGLAAWCVALVSWAASVSAGDRDIKPPAAEATCVTYDAVYENAPMMAVKPPQGELRVYLQKTATPCPASGACAQRQKAFLVEGDQVFASQEKNGFRCAYYGTAGGQLIAGFLPARSLAPLKEETGLTPEFLAGAWNDSGDTVSFSAAGGGKVHASGTATWQGMNKDDVHDGEFDAQAMASGSEAVFKDDACEVHVRRRGNYLVLDDNSVCGGMNVRFMGIYVRKHPAVR
ncbi:MAG TPA: hypothetical protein VGH80_07950 [Xanthomonadaceae bacterium]